MTRREKLAQQSNRNRTLESVVAAPRLLFVICMYVCIFIRTERLVIERPLWPLMVSISSNLLCHL